MTQTPEQIQRHYLIEKELAQRLRHSRAEERVTLYSEVYDELYRRVPDHPMLVAKEEQSRIRQVSVGRKLSMLRRYLKRDTVFLEIGAGDCLMSIQVAQRVAKVIAVEVSSVISDSSVLPPNMTIRIIDGPADIPADPGSVDVVFSDQLAEHLHPEDFVQQVANVHRALAPGGCYLLCTPNGLNGPHDVSRGFDATSTGMHLREYSHAEIAEILTGAGFSRVAPLVGFKGVYVKVPAWLPQWVEALVQALPARWGRWLGNTLVMQVILAIRVVATK